MTAGGAGARFARWARRNKVLYLLVAALGVLGILGLHSHDPSPSLGRGFWSGLMDNGWVLAVVQVAIIYAAGYVIYSVVHNVSRGVPLKELAGAKVADQVSEELKQLRRAHSNVVATLSDRDRDLAASNQTIAQLRDALATVLTENAALRSDLNPPIPMSTLSTLEASEEGQEP